MRKGLPWLLVVCLSCTSPLFAQPTLPALPSEQTESSDLPSLALELPPVAPTRLRYWLSAEALIWWTKPAPLPIPLVTTGDPNDPRPGALAQPGTQLLRGHSRFRFHDFSGTRFVIGAWVDRAQNIGVEANVFCLDQHGRRFIVSSDVTGNPLLAVPYLSQTPGVSGEAAVLIARPNQLAGDVAARSSLRLWGTEANGVFCMWREPGFSWTMLAGFRHVDLQESLSISGERFPFAANPNTSTFFNDFFGTRNQFYGGQIGVQLQWLWNRWSFDTTAKLALGGTHQLVEIDGQSTRFGPNPGTFPGGLFTQPTSMGRTSANQFAIIPSLELKFAYQCTPRLRVFAGYDFLYWNQVVRPGNQIDRNINFTQSTVFGAGALTGPAFPTPLFERTDFWAQGISLGIELRF